MGVFRPSLLTESTDSMISASTNSWKYKKMTARNIEKAGLQVVKQCEHSLLPCGRLAMPRHNAYSTLI